MKFNLKTLREKYEKLDTQIAKLPSEYFERIGSLSVEFDDELKNFDKELQQYCTDLENASTLTDWGRGLFFGKVSLIKEVLGK